MIESLENRTLLTGITPVILSDTVPSQVLAGAKLHASLELALTNSEASTDTLTTVNIYASPTGALDTTADPLVLSVPRPVKIGSLKTAGYKVNIAGLPSSLVVGTAYTLIAQTVDLSGNTAAIGTNSTVSVAAANITLSETVATTFPPNLVSGTKIKGSVKVGITNNGNVPSKGKVTINLTASATPGVAGTSIVSSTKNLNIGVAKEVFVTVPISQLPVLEGVYYIVAQVTDPNQGVTIATSTPVTFAAPTVTLSATIGAIVKLTSGATVYVTNSGNVADVSSLQGTFGVSLDAAGADPVGGTVTLTSPKLNIRPGKTATFHVKPSKAFLADLTAGVPYYLTLSFVDSTGHGGTAVSPNTFTF